MPIDGVLTSESWKESTGRVTRKKISTHPSLDSEDGMLGAWVPVVISSKEEANNANRLEDGV